MTVKRFDIMRRSDGELMFSTSEDSPLGQVLADASRLGFAPALLGHGLVAWDRESKVVIYRA